MLTMNGPVHLLVIDDNPDDRLLAIRALRREFRKLDVREIGDASAFAAALEAGDFDAVVTDYKLGWSDGLSILRTLKARYPDRPMIMFTSTGDEEVAVEAMKAGVDDYVVKAPHHFVRLPLAVRAALERAAASRRVAQAEEALRQSEAKLRMIVEQAPALLWTTDTGLRVTSVSGTALTQIGREPGEYLEKTFYELAGTEDPNFPPLAAHLRALEGATGTYDREAGGRLLEARVEPLRDGAGRIVGCLGLALDVTERRQAEQALRRSEERFRSLVQNASDIITVIRPDGTILYQSPSIERVLGYKPEELIGRNAYTVIPLHPDDHARREQLRSEFLQAGEASVTGELRLRHADGSWHYIEVTIKNLLHDPEVGGIVSNYRDITPRKRAERRLSTQYEVSRVLVDALDIAEVVPRLLRAIGEGLEWDYGSLWTVDWHDNVLRCVDDWHTSSREFRELAAINRRTAFAPGAGLPGRVWQTGKPVWIVDAAEEENLPRMSVAAVEGLRGGFGMPIRIGARTIGVFEFFSHEVREPDQELLAMMAALGGQIGQFIERKWAEEQLRVRERQQAAVAVLGRRALATLDLQILMDEMAILVAQTLQVELCKILELLPAGDALLLRAGMGWQDGYMGRATVSAGADSPAGYTLVSGGPVIVQDLPTETRWQGTALLHDHGVVSGANVIIQGWDKPFGVLGVDTRRRHTFTQDDIHFLQSVANVLTTALERMAFEQRLALEQAAVQAGRVEAERLAELDRLRQEFISTISHDLRTPLTAGRVSLGMLELSARARLRPDEAHLLENAQGDMERLSKQIDDLLALNQLEAGALRLDRERLDLRSVAVDAGTAVYPLFAEKGQKLELDLPASLPALGDARRLEQVVINLLDNAHRHTPDGANITLTGRAVDDEIEVAVRDDGPGIPAAELQAIFQRFHRADAAAGGSGLGLAIAKALVELHGGRIWAESEPGHGATFHVRLPHAERSTG